MWPVNDFARRNEPYNDLGSALDDVFTLVFKSFGRRKSPFYVKVVNDFARPHEPYIDLGSALDDVYTPVFKVFGRRKLPFCVKVTTYGTC